MRWIVRGLSAVVALVVLTLAALWLIPSEVVARAASAQFAQLTGRTLTIEGGIRPTIWPVIGVSTGPVTLANADWSAEGPMMQAEALVMALDIGAALGGRVQLRAVEVRGLRLVLERFGDGRVNWATAPGAAAPVATGPGGAGAAPVTLERGQISGGTVVWIDHAAGSRQTIGAIEAVASLIAPDGAVTLEGTARMGDTPLRLSLRAADAGALAAGRVTPVELTAAAGGTTVDFDGRAGLSPLVAEGRLAANLADLRALAALTGAGVPDLPEGLGRRVREVTGQLTLAPAGSAHLRDGGLVLDANRLSLAADLTLDGPRPKLAAQVQGGTLVLAGPGAPGAGGGGGAPSGADAGWSRAAMDVSALGVMDAEVAIRADALDLGATRTGPLRLMLTLDRARAVIEARELQAWGGQITGQFVLNGRSGMSVGGDLVLAGLAMQPLLAEMAGYDRLSATGDLRVKFLGLGNSMAAIMASLSGEGRLVLGRGELRGLDLLGMLRTLDPGFVGAGQRTIFDGISGSFTIRDGVLRNDDLRLAAPYLTAAGQGTVGLGAQVLDYRITPTALAREDGTGGLRVPLAISGPWSAPRFRLDLKALADQELAEERAKLEARAKEAEARAKAALEAKAAEELGIVRQDGESLENAARRRAEEALRDEAGRALNRLLGGN
ncbi:MAG: AsmA-like C-terminal region-containing protein [Gemmobacter sp.]